MLNLGLRRKYTICMFLQTQPHIVFCWCRSRVLKKKKKKKKCECVNGPDSHFLLSYSLRLNPANVAVSVPSQSLGQFVLLPKRHSDDWNLTWHCLLDTVNFCYFLFLYNIHCWINLFCRLPFFPLLHVFKGGSSFVEFASIRYPDSLEGFHLHDKVAVKLHSSIFPSRVELLMHFERTHVGRTTDSSRVACQWVLYFWSQVKGNVCQWIIDTTL